MNRILATILLLAAVAIAGCSGTPEVRATAAAAIACDAYATVLDQLTPMYRAGKVSAVNAQRVDVANRSVKPLCERGAVVDPAAVVSTVGQAVSLLNAVKDTAAVTPAGAAPAATPPPAPVPLASSPPAAAAPAPAPAAPTPAPRTVTPPSITR